MNRRGCRGMALNRLRTNRLASSCTQPNALSERVERCDAATLAVFDVAFGQHDASSVRFKERGSAMGMRCAGVYYDAPRRVPAKSQSCRAKDQERSAQHRPVQSRPREARLQRPGPGG